MLSDSFPHISTEPHHAIPHNSAALKAMRREVGYAWYQALKRRSQRGRIPWARMNLLIATYLPPARILQPWPSQRLRVT